MGHFIRIVYFVVACGDWFDVVTNCTTVVVLRLLDITRLRAQGCAAHSPQSNVFFFRFNCWYFIHQLVKRNGQRRKSQFDNITIVSFFSEI